MADSGRVDDLLAVTRAHYRAPPAARERVWSGLAASGQHLEERSEELGAEGSADAAVAGAASRLPGARLAGVSKPTAALLAGLTFVAGFWLGGGPLHEPPASVSPSSASSPSSALLPSALPSASAPPSLSPTQTDVGATVGVATVLQAAPPTARSSKRKRSAEAAPPAIHRAERANATNTELALLQRADHALRSGSPELALSFLADLERRHPVTLLGEERTAARLMAHCARSDDDGDARAEAQRFLQNRRASMYADRLRELCGLTP
ncbi:MAG: hypothetical protein RL033_5120 [Pseudomonadota bacterium]